ncbi:50S ribosomal protein L23 [candidate division WS6 bacterium RIFOXYD1_FULL_33_8]|uniref:Large ribosomal subunit protein uL23 n=2 Tax=Candidatus Dojkabacteria TaxID=74243 RepID=A0A0G0ATB8_9BACT|nr:MAG: 50S ribosomal protein L25, large subunit ribosomal protein L23 [candidate division WS6 bacterium GW2011_GWE2_33_157]KKP44564.1 MAG: 50S ribosomal protein L25, large subunit ribosomal protein L23 [candidate division WS6 bacterium GW2011_GWC1_33_20]KKP46126.1 MAG: 50S ribosomal protein L25, large subunit ribosomal protein L23 [candidate division WS6 bacterium GW2011_GWF1_33_233]KKP54661.1 MAG: 50S ribosomal protein L23 [candidate division WS6 bacterium GW2011_GWB1_33_6]KKP55390.1 MAG: 50S
MEIKKIELKPVVSEKSYNLVNTNNKYIFFVDTDVNRIEIKKAVEEKYKVKVTNVNILVKPGKSTRDWKTNRTFRKTDKKKAVVTLKKGDKIGEFLNT